EAGRAMVRAAAEHADGRAAAGVLIALQPGTLVAARAAVRGIVLEIDAVRSAARLVRSADAVAGGADLIRGAFRRAVAAVVGIAVGRGLATVAAQIGVAAREARRAEDRALRGGTGEHRLVGKDVLSAWERRRVVRRRRGIADFAARSAVVRVLRELHA